MILFHKPDVEIYTPISVSDIIYFRVNTLSKCEASTCFSSLQNINFFPFLLSSRLSAIDRSPRVRDFILPERRSGRGREGETAGAAADVFGQRNGAVRGQGATSWARAMFAGICTGGKGGGEEWEMATDRVRDGRWRSGFIPRGVRPTSGPSPVGASYSGMQTERRRRAS